MKCKFCEKGFLVECTECGSKIVVCGEYNSSVQYSCWDNDCGCDGI